MNALSRYSIVTFVAAILLLGSQSSGRAATPTASSPGPEPIKVEVPASATQRNPVKIATVTTGQKITVTIGHVLWKGGGTRTGDSTDWRGFKNRLEKNSLPWMALVFAVGKQTILPDKKEFIFTAPADGDLVAFANDSNPNGNTGKGEVTVIISPK
jgi:hypothetical protein